MRKLIAKILLLTIFMSVSLLSFTSCSSGDNSSTTTTEEDSTSSSESSQEEEVDENLVYVYLIAGQSNAAGNGYLEDLSTDNKKTYQNVFWYAGGDVNPSYEERLACVSGAYGQGVNAASFGLEQGMAQILSAQTAEDGIKRAIIKCAFDGSSIKEDPVSNPQFGNWNVYDDAGDGGNYTEFLRVVNAGMQALEDYGLTPVISGMAWLQGESDAWLTDYGLRLMALRDTAIEDLETPNMNFVMGEISNVTCGSGNKVNEAINKLANMDTANNAVVACGDIATRCTQAESQTDAYNSNDYLHWSGENLISIGQMFAEKLLLLEYYDD